jgi:hypothetical protein
MMVTVGSTQYLDKQNGFSDAQFGQEITAFKGLVLASALHDPRVLTYARDTDALQYLGYPVRQIHYRFFDQQLYRIDLLTTGTDTIAGLRQEFVRLYGPPTLGLLGEEWQGQQVTASILAFRTQSENAYFTLYSQVLMAAATEYVYHRGLVANK